MPDFENIISSLLSAVPDLGDAFWRGGKYAVAAFALIGIIYFLRKYL
jgi:hypothetical protein